MTAEERRYQRELEAETKGVQFVEHERVERKFRKQESNLQKQVKERAAKEKHSFEVNMMPKKDKKIYQNSMKMEKKKQKRVRKLETRAAPSPKRQKQN